MSRRVLASRGTGGIRATGHAACARDLTLRHRVTGYRAGDLKRLYPSLDIHEDVVVNYGFVTPAVQALMHSRSGHTPWAIIGVPGTDPELASLARAGAQGRGAKW